MLNALKFYAKFVNNHTECNGTPLVMPEVGAEFFCISIVFANIGVPEILSRNLKVMSARMSSRETLNMVEMAPDRWEYVVH